MRDIEYYVIGEHKFEIVEKIPSGYHVWNIGDNMGRDDLIPLARRMSDDIRSDDYYKIDPKSLKAIHLDVDEVRVLREASAWGINDLKSARIWERNTGRSYNAIKRIDNAVASVSIFERISE